MSLLGSGLCTMDFQAFCSNAFCFIEFTKRTKTGLLQKSLYTQQKKLSSLMRDCNLPIFTANETITNLMQYKLSQGETDLIKTGLYFSIQPDKIRKSEIFTTFEKIHCSFLNSRESQKSDKSASLVSCSSLFLQLQTFSTYTTSALRLMKH